MQNIQRSALERTLAYQNAMMYLTAEEFTTWENFKYVERFVCHVGRKLVLWQQWLDEPLVVDVFTVTDIRLHPTEGFTIEFSDRDGDLYACSHSPEPIADNTLFAHVPFMPEVTYLPSSGGDNAYKFQLPIVVKSQSNPKTPFEGHFYLEAIGKFKFNNPQFKDEIL